MYNSRIVATVTLESMTPYSQSRQHGEPFLENESADAHDKRTWRARLTVENGTVRIPVKAITDALVDAAGYTGIKIQGGRGKTWKAKFQSGIAIFENPDLGIKPDDVPYIDLPSDANGKRGSGTRVMRRFPMINQWRATFDVHILDPVITEEIFTKVMNDAGLFIGIGRYRPQNRGTNGRFKLAKLVWKEDRQIAA
jgi:hypothetical protein